MNSTTKIPVNGPAPYSVIVGRGVTSEAVDAIADSGARHVAVVHQPTLSGPAQKFADAVKAAGPDCILLEVPDAESAKTVEVLDGIWGHLAAHGFTRSDALVGFGGGAVTDLAGFAAATWMRGIKVFHVPTSLLAMVDAAVGGKTGINTAAGKNLVGAFHEPSGVFIDVDYLASLSRDELVAGSAEIIKTGFIADERILELYEADPDACYRVDGHLQELIERSVTVKANVVGADLKESGLREILNYGHTFGHAVEKVEDFTWRHGNAVAVGMMFIAHLAHDAGLIDDNLVDRHRQILTSVGLPTTYAGSAFAPLHEAMLHDKKNKSGVIRFVALDGEVGKTTRLEGPTTEQLERAFASVVAEGK
ncbi:3-dehydroquinate synthase [Corynebacterium renale]|uniref:3-dehydroquinate synthase n=1 Tax=Corynebacterium renale TaxID=1724 RepID=UPI000DA35A9C|nr:3-dehydroquinate synthase [Corynebacterium renale]SQG64772.1 3-dehydroquinate synthase [Corynebacterium renale]